MQSIFSLNKTSVGPGPPIRNATAIDFACEKGDMHAQLWELSLPIKDANKYNSSLNIAQLQYDSFKRGLQLLKVPKNL